MRPVANTRMPLNNASCIPPVSTVQHGGQIRHYTTWYPWSDHTLHYVIFLVRSDTTLPGISGHIRHYTTWYLWSDQTLHYVVFLVRSDTTLCGISGQIERLWAKRRGLQRTAESRLVRSKRNRIQAHLLASQVLALPSGQTC